MDGLAGVLEPALDEFKSWIEEHADEFPGNEFDDIWLTLDNLVWPPSFAKNGVLVTTKIQFLVTTKTCP